MILESFGWVLIGEWTGDLDEDEGYWQRDCIGRLIFGMGGGSSIWQRFTGSKRNNDQMVSHYDVCQSMGGGQLVVIILPLLLLECH